MFDDLMEAQKKRYEAMAHEPIKITLPDGAVKEGVSWETTPLDVAKAISSGLANVVVGAKVNGVSWDLTRRLEGDCTLRIVFNIFVSQLGAYNDLFKRSFSRI